MNQNKLINAVREHLEKVKDVQNVIVWEVKDDESQDPTLLSFRAYGTREHSDIVRIACGVDWAWQNLPQITIILPKLATVIELKRKYRE